MRPPDPTGGNHTAPPDPLAGFQGATSLQGRGREKGEKEEKKENGRGRG